MTPNERKMYRMRDRMIGELNRFIDRHLHNKSIGWPVNTRGRTPQPQLVPVRRRTTDNCSASRHQRKGELDRSFA